MRLAETNTKDRESSGNIQTLNYACMHATFGNYFWFLRASYISYPMSSNFN